ncbi:unannotated protein [freshwater metagenome]|uniref:Unannotated protein n=1 Tax=freshwater metagenome TaxID=449393 RepID=A0A6J7DPG7_9ZZZZ
MRARARIGSASRTRGAHSKSTGALSAIVMGLVLVAGACGGGSGQAEKVSSSGTRLLAASSLKSGASDAVSYSAESSGGDGSTARESFSRRGEDSVVTAEYDSGGRLEVRRVGGEFYVLSSLDIVGATPMWVHVANDADRTFILSLLGSDYVAPTPKEASTILSGGVLNVRALKAKAGQRVLTVTARSVGERPSEISIDRSEALFLGRVASLWSGKTKVGERTYRSALWGDAVPAIMAPAGASEFNGVFDSQVLKLAEPLRRRPMTLPANWGIRAVVGLSTGQGNGVCQEVLTLYAPPAPARISDDYLAVYLEPTGCSTPRANGSADFVAGVNAGWIGKAPDGSTIGSLQVEGTSLRFRTSLDAKALASTLSVWGPL